MLSILTSKYDIVSQRKIGDSSIADFINNLIVKFREKFSGQLKDLNFLDVAAMPDDITELEIGYGLKSLISYWVKDDDETDKLIQNDILDDSTSEFNSFACRARG